MADIPNPFTSGDGPLPTDDSELVAQIKALAAARERHALTHRWNCNCDGCVIRRGGQRIVVKDPEAA
jgi:hypothetical protein